MGFPFFLVLETPPAPGVDVPFFLPGVLGAFLGVLGPLGGLGPPIWLKNQSIS